MGSKKLPVPKYGLGDKVYVLVEQSGSLRDIQAVLETDKTITPRVLLAKLGIVTNVTAKKYMRTSHTNIGVDIITDHDIVDKVTYRINLPHLIQDVMLEEQNVHADLASAMKVIKSVALEQARLQEISDKV